MYSKKRSSTKLRWKKCVLYYFLPYVRNGLTSIFVLKSGDKYYIFSISHSFVNLQPSSVYFQKHVKCYSKKIQQSSNMDNDCVIDNKSNNNTKNNEHNNNKNDNNDDNYDNDDNEDNHDNDTNDDKENKKESNNAKR
jgi:hypothetical protein